MLVQYNLWIKKFLTLVGIGVLLLAVVSACSQSPVSTADSTHPIRIGIAIPTSGDFAADGKAMQQGYQLWADTVNANGGMLGREVQLDIIANNSDPDQIAAQYKKLITVDHVDLVFGPFSTLLTKAAAKVANQYHYAMIEGAGGGPSIFDLALPNLFAVSLPVENNLVSSALYILSLPADMRPKTVAYATEDDPFTQPQVDLAKKMLDKGGVRSVYYHVYPADTTKDYTPFARAIVQSGAQAVILGTLLPDVTAFINTFKQLNYNPKLLVATAGPDLGSDFIKAVSLKSTEGVMVPNGWYVHADTFQNAQMVQGYLAKYGGTADAINADVAEAYSVGQVAEQAISKVGRIDNNALIQELHTDIFNSVQGTVQFDKVGRNKIALPYLFQWQQGVLIPVYPDTIAVANPEFPRPQWT